MTRLYMSPPHMGPDERALLLGAFDSNWIAPAGPDLEQFEEELSAALGGLAVAAVSSGTAALHLALLILGIGPGDEVLAPTLTFAASVNPVIYVGADLAFLDSGEGDWNLDPDLLAAELSARARVDALPSAVIAVDLYGQPADYDAIAGLCAHYELPLIEDAAEALGSTFRGRAAGSLGDIGILSFNGNKIITTGGGGALVCSNPTQVARARHLATQARQPAPHYEHREIGYNYRLSNLSAAIGRGQLRVLPERVIRRRQINERYRELLGHLPGLGFAPRPASSESNCWLSCITIDPVLAGTDRDKVRLRLEDADIESRPLWKPMHMQPVHAARPARLSGVSQRLFDIGLCLPSGTAMTDDQQLKVAEIVASCFT